MGVRHGTGFENAHMLRCEAGYELVPLVKSLKIYCHFCFSQNCGRKTFHGKTRRQNELLRWSKEPKDKMFSSPEHAESHSVKNLYSRVWQVFSVTETERNHFLNVITLLHITFFLHSHKSDVLRLWPILEFKLPSLCIRHWNRLELSWPLFHSDNQWHQDHTLKESDRISFYSWSII